MLIGPKRRKKEPSRLKEYAVTVTTAADFEDCTNKNDSEAENYWKLNAFFAIMDTIISNMKRRFSTESLQIATSADCLMQFDFNGSLHLIDHYKVIKYIIFFNKNTSRLWKLIKYLSLINCCIVLTN